MRTENFVTRVVAVTLLLFVPTLFALSAYAVDKAPYCEAEANRADRPEQPGTSLGDKNKTAGKNDDGAELDIEGEQPRLRVVCRGMGGGAGGRMTWLLAAIAAAFAALAALLARRSVVEERGARRGRIVAEFTDGDQAIVRMVNIGESAAWLTSLGWSALIGPPSRVKLKAASRLVPKGGEEGADFAFAAARVEDGARFTIIWRYRDAYGDEWHAWRVFRMSPARNVIVEEDGEHPAD
jgi:hypothetical protein